MGCGWKGESRRVWRSNTRHRRWFKPFHTKLLQVALAAGGDEGSYQPGSLKTDDRVSTKCTVGRDYSLHIDASGENFLPGQQHLLIKQKRTAQLFGLKAEACTWATSVAMAASSAGAGPSNCTCTAAIGMSRATRAPRSFRCPVNHGRNAGCHDAIVSAAAMNLELSSLPSMAKASTRFHFTFAAASMYAIGDASNGECVRGAVDAYSLFILGCFGIRHI